MGGKSNHMGNVRDRRHKRAKGLTTIPAECRIFCCIFVGFLKLSEIVVRDRDDNRSRLGCGNRRAMKGASLGWFFDNFAARWATRPARGARCQVTPREMAKRSQFR